MTEAKLKLKLKELLGSLNIYFQSEKILDDANLFNLGVLDSLMLIQFVVAIEDEFKIRIKNADIHYDNFITLNSLAKIIFKNYLQKN
jgi:acyl carrier protein